jgi:hypothetical protein
MLHFMHRLQGRIKADDKKAKRLADNFGIRNTGSHERLSVSVPSTIFPPYARHLLFQGAVHVYSVSATQPADGPSSGGISKKRRRRSRSKRRRRSRSKRRRRRRRRRRTGALQGYVC